MSGQAMSGAMVETAAGVDFPVADDGRRSTSAFGRAVIADALRGTDAAGALGAEQETNWRSGYLTHFRRVIEAGLPSRQAAPPIAADGAGSPRPRGPGLGGGVLRAAGAGPGTFLVPVPVPPGPGGGAGHPAPGQPTADATADSVGADLTSEVPEVADWLAGLRGPVVLGNYVYADGAANVRVCAAADTLTLRLQAARDDVALAFLATPTDVSAVPADAVEQSARAYGNRSASVKLASRPLRALSGGRLLRRAYRPGSDPGISDNLVAQQGPNYALAKRLQRWRASLAPA